MTTGCQCHLQRVWFGIDSPDLLCSRLDEREVDTLGKPEHRVQTEQACKVPLPDNGDRVTAVRCRNDLVGCICVVVLRLELFESVHVRRVFVVLNLCISFLKGTA